MPEFLVELYIARTDAAAARRGARRAHRVADEMTRQGTPVRYVRSIFVPEDETCFVLYEAASAELVRTAAQRAGLSFAHVAESTREESFR